MAYIFLSSASEIVLIAKAWDNKQSIYLNDVKRANTVRLFGIIYLLGAFFSSLRVILQTARANMRGMKHLINQNDLNIVSAAV